VVEARVGATELAEGHAYGLVEHIRQRFRDECLDAIDLQVHRRRPEEDQGDCSFANRISVLERSRTPVQ
jgi:hypothetical protein